MSLTSVVQEVEAKVEGFLEKLNPFAHKAEAEVTADVAKAEAVAAPVVQAAETKVEDAVGAAASTAAEKAVAAVVPTV
jgi:hypothetical protein